MDRALANDRQPFFRHRPGGLGLPRLTRLTWGIALLAVALLGAAVNTGNNLLYVLFALLLATLPVSLAASWLNLCRLTAELRLPPSPRAGAPFTLEVRLGSSRRIAARSVSVQVITRRREHGPALVERVLPGETIRVRLPADPARRGPLAVVGIRLESSFPLGLLKRARFFPVNRELLVLPSSAPAVLRAVAADAEPGDAGRAAAVPGQEFEGLRRGRKEDDARRIDWKSTARRGHPMVRETTGEGRPHVRVELTTRRRGASEEARAVFEEEVSRVAGRAGAALRASGVVRLIVDGGSEEMFSGRWGHRALLHRLARLVPTDEDGRRLPPLTAEKVEEPAAADPESRAADLRATPPGRSHRASCLLALAVGTTALFAYDGLGLPSFIILAASMALAALVGDRVITRGPILTWLWKAAAFSALVAYFADLVVIRHNPLQASLGLVVFITLFKLFNSRTARDDRQLLLISLLQMIMAAALTTGVSFIVPLLVWVAAAVHAQVAWTTLPSRSRLALFVGPAVPSPRPGLFSRAATRYAMPTARVVAGLLVLGAAIFLLVPHLGTGTFAPGPLRGIATTGFSETTRLGDIGRIKLNSARVMEVRVTGPGARQVELKWRGMALDRFDGRTWTRSIEAAGWSPTDPGLPLSLAPGLAAGRQDPSLRLVQEIRLEPRIGRMVFAASRPVTITFDDYMLVAQDPAGSVFLPQPPRRKLAYTVESQPPPFDPVVLGGATGNDPAAVRHLHLRLPPLDDRIAVLARRLTDATTTRHGAALAIEQWLSTNLRYSLQVNDSEPADPLAAFLFDDMAAHCEYFATAMVVLARSAGIPARFVAGYLRGEQNRFSRGYTVRQSDAHSWVEVYFPRIGWVPFDPTPPAGRGSWDNAGWLDLPRDIYATVARLWDDYVIGIDLGDQARLYLFLRDTLLERVFALRAALITGPAFKVMMVAGILVPWLLWLLASHLRRRQTRKRVETVNLRAAPRFYRQMLRFLARRGLARQAGETPGEFATRAAGVLPHLAAGRIRDLTDLYHRIRFDAGADAGASRTLARRLLADLRREAGYPRQPAAAPQGPR